MTQKDQREKEAQDWVCERIWEHDYRADGPSHAAFIAGCQSEARRLLRGVPRRQGHEEHETDSQGARANYLGANKMTQKEQREEARKNE